jgi:hypothetical protein
VPTGHLLRRDLLRNLRTRRIPLRMGIPNRLGALRTTRRARRLTWFRNRTVRVDRRLCDRADFDVFRVFGKELFPVLQGAEFLFGEAPEIVCEVGLEAAGDECSRGVTSGAGISRVSKLLE